MKRIISICVLMSMVFLVTACSDTQPSNIRATKVAAAGKKGNIANPVINNDSLLATGERCSLMSRVWELELARYMASQLAWFYIKQDAMRRLDSELVLRAQHDRDFVNETNFKFQRLESKFYPAVRGAEGEYWPLEINATGLTVDDGGENLLMSCPNIKARFKVYKSPFSEVVYDLVRVMEPETLNLTFRNNPSNAWKFDQSKMN